MDSIWPYIGEGVDIMPGDANLFAGIALACRRFSRHSACQSYANIALINEPGDILAQALLTPAERISVVRQLLHHQQIDKAIELLNALEKFAPTDESAFYLGLLDFYNTQKKQAMAPVQMECNGRPTLLNVNVWGQGYIDKLFKYSLPSLLAPGNLPALSKIGTIFFDIYTSAKDQAALRDSAVMQAVARYAHINYIIFPDELLYFQSTEATKDHDRFVVAGAQYTAAIHAKHLNADLFYVNAEGIYSDNVLKSTKAYITEGYKAVLTLMLRARESEIDNYLKRHAAIVDQTIVINTPDLIDFAVKNLNPEIFSSFIRSDVQHVAQDPIALFFKTPIGFSSHTFQILAAMISHEILPADFIYDYHTEDARFLAEITDGQDPATLFKIVENPSNEFVALDLDAGSDGLERVFGSFPVDIQTCAKSAIKWCNKESDFEYFEWAFQQRFELECGSSTEILPDSDFDESETVKDFLVQFRKLQAEKRSNIRVYNGDFFVKK